MKCVISVVIPTHNRPHCVQRAVQSVLNQTFQEFEALVVLDGPDRFTYDALATICDSRLRVIELSENRGPGGARNAGIAEARGDWIALLDDDDEWLPEKLERQLECARRSQYKNPIVVCCFFARTAYGDTVWPRRLPLPGEHLSEYLFTRSSLFAGERVMATPTLLSTQAVFRRVPFSEGVLTREDWEWLLLANELDGFGIEYIPEPLAICHFEENRDALTPHNNWRSALAWIQEKRELVTPRAYAGFLLIEAAGQASRQRDWTACWPLLHEAFAHGAPTPFHLALYCSIWSLSPSVRQWLRKRFTQHGVQVG